MSCQIWTTYICIFCSPDEAHNALIVKISPTRTNELANLRPDRRHAVMIGIRRVLRLLDAKMDSCFFSEEMTINDLMPIIPDDDERKAKLANDPLASVDGFQAIALLTCNLLFGMNVCNDCPQRNCFDGSTVRSSSRLQGVLLDALKRVKLVLKHKNEQELYMRTANCLYNVCINIIHCR